MVLAPDSNRIRALGVPCSVHLSYANLGWHEELESSFSDSQSPALPYKLMPHLVDRPRIELGLDGCRPSVLPLSLSTLTLERAGTLEVPYLVWKTSALPLKLRPQNGASARSRIGLSALPRPRIAVNASPAWSSDSESNRIIRLTRPTHRQQCFPSFEVSLNCASRAWVFTPRG